MLRTRRKSISLLVALAFVLTLVLPVGAALATGSATLTSDPSPLTEANLDGAKLYITLSGNTFADSVVDDPSNFSIMNGPTGLSIWDVQITGTRTATITLAFDGRDFDGTITNFFVKIAAAELTDTTSEIDTNPISITAIAEESIDVIDDGNVAEGKESQGKLIITVQEDTFDSASITGNILLDGGPVGVAFGDPIYSPTNGWVEVPITHNATKDYDSPVKVDVTVNRAALATEKIGDPLTATYYFTPTIEAINVADDGQVAEGREGGEVLTVTLTGDTFKPDVAAAGNVIMYGQPAGVGIGGVRYVNPTTIQIVLSGNATVDYDGPVQATIVVKADGLNWSNDIPGTYTFVGTDEGAVAIDVRDDGEIVEGREDGEVLTVTLTGDTFTRDVELPGNVVMYGQPAGVSIDWVEYVNPTMIRIHLAGNAAVDYDSDRTATIRIEKDALTLSNAAVTARYTFKATVEGPSLPSELEKYRNGFSSSYTHVLTGKNAEAGFAAIRLPEDPDVPRYADKLVVNVTLPDGVLYMSKAGDTATARNYYVKVYGKSGELPFTLVSSSRSDLEISVSGVAQPLELAVVFSFDEEGKSALEIDSDYSGDIKATVEYVGFDDRGKTVFSGSEDLLIARVASGEVTVSAASPKTVAVGSNREAAKITIAEGTAGTLKGATITLEIVTDGASFNSDTKSKVSGIRYLIPSSSVTITGDDDEILEIEMPSTQAVGLPGKVEVTPYLDLTPDASGEIEIQVTVTKGDKDLADETVTVAKVAAAVSYTVTDVKNTGGSIVAGHDASVLKEEGDAAEFTIETVGSATFPRDALIYVELSGAKFDSSKPFKVDGSYAGVKTYNDNKAAWFAPPDEDDEVTLSDFKVKADGEAAAGDIVLKFSSNLGTFDPAEVVIGKVVKPFEVTASAAPAIAYLGRAQAAGDIVIKETKKGALDQAIQLELPEGVSFTSKPTVKVTDGNLDLGSTSLEDRGRILVIEVSDKSTRPSTVTISGIKYDVSRLALDGDVEVKIVGAEDTRSGWEDKTIATVVNAKVVSAAKREASFVIGSTTYTVNGEEYTMDVAPYIDAATGRTYVPVRYVAYALGVAEENIFWDAQARTVTLLKGDRVVQMTIGSKAMFINGASLAMDAAPEIKDGRTMLPFRWAAQALGASVSWDEATKTVTMKIE